jgi:hypothetical protein
MALTNGENPTSVSQTSTMKWMEEWNVYDDEIGEYVRFFGIFEPPDMTWADETAFTVTVDQPGMRLDQLAAQYLGDKRLAWILALYNDLEDFYEELYPGQQLQVPERQATIDNILNLPKVQRRTV